MDIKTYDVTVLGYKSVETKKGIFRSIYFACNLGDLNSKGLNGLETGSMFGQNLSDDLYIKFSKHKPGDIVKAIVTRDGYNLSIYDIV